MKTSKEEKELQPLNIERAKSVIEKYFMDVNVEKLELRYPVHGNLEVEIIYEDFKPERVVRRELEDLIPFSNINVTREISEKEGKKAFWDAWYDYASWELVIEGKKQEIMLRSLIYEHLEDKTL